MHISNAGVTFGVLLTFNLLFMTSIIVLEIKTGHKSYQSYQTREDAIAAGKWYKSLKLNGAPKYRVLIEKVK